MKYSQVFLTAALASVAAARPRVHARLPAEVFETETVVDVVTVEETVTAGKKPYHTHHWHHAIPTTSSEAVTSATLETSYVATSASVSVAAASSSASPVTSINPGGLEKPASSSPASSAAPSTTEADKAAGGSAATGSASSAKSSGISLSNLSPNGKKAGLSGYVGIQSMSAFSSLAPYISWYSDYTPNTPSEQDVMGVGMLWGASGSTCGSVETDRLSTFNSMVSGGDTPDIMFGFYEPDCTCPMSSDMSTSSGASDWDSLIAPLGEKGTILGSPSMCKQKDEDWLTPFNSSISRTWDVTAVHINKPDLAGAKEDIEYYSSTYGKPIWVAEFACVHDQPSWEPCTDQSEIDSFINDVVSYFQGNDDVVAYGPSNGEGLGDVWPLTDSNGDLTASGNTYLNAIKSL